MPTFIEFCATDFEKIFKVAHVKNANNAKKKNCNLTPCSIFSNNGHVFSWIKNPNNHFVQNTLRNNHAKFKTCQSSSFRGEDFFKICPWQRRRRRPGELRKKCPQNDFIILFLTNIFKSIILKFHIFTI